MTKHDKRLAKFGTKYYGQDNHVGTRSGDGPIKIYGWDFRTGRDFEWPLRWCSICVELLEEDDR